MEARGVDPLGPLQSCGRCWLLALSLALNSGSQLLSEKPQTSVDSARRAEGADGLQGVEEETEEALGI